MNGSTNTTAGRKPATENETSPEATPSVRDAHNSLNELVRDVRLFAEVLDEMLAEKLVPVELPQAWGFSERSSYTILQPTDVERLGFLSMQLMLHARKAEQQTDDLWDVITSAAAEAGR